MIALTLLTMISNAGVAMPLAQGQATNFVPTDTKVLILGGINNTEEKDESHKKAECDQYAQRLTELFTERKFRLASADESARARKASGIDWSDREQWTKANLKKAGQSCQAQIVTFAVITDSTQRTSSGMFGGKVGRVKLTLWIYDVKGSRAIVDAKELVGESKGGYGAFGEGQGRRVAAVRIALDNALVKDRAGFLNGFPTK